MNRHSLCAEFAFEELGGVHAIKQCRSAERPEAAPLVVAAQNRVRCYRLKARETPSTRRDLLYRPFQQPLADSRAADAYE